MVPGTEHGLSQRPCCRKLSATHAQIELLHILEASRKSRSRDIQRIGSGTTVCGRDFPFREFEPGATVAIVGMYD